MSDATWGTVRAVRAWLDQVNGTGGSELTCRILKVTEEAGEAAGAWIGMTGQNPRKGVTHSLDDVAGELADVALTALVAIESLGLDARQVLRTRADRVQGRLAALPAAVDVPADGVPRPGGPADGVPRPGVPAGRADPAPSLE
ncbi:MazG-like family protein [Plantactinospora alkalitolerans]|uniref:MazG-like family protein n=1 Tax=Plantactinospora alkalitolerans TaxID=2789879 RepID=UPI001E2E80AF|nr:MazG-like family protein [Plantactinospora alkalitolerans]